jgi:hypothetical protein
VCVELNKVRKLPARGRLLYWIREREAVRLKKESGAPTPWTDDEIIRRYRFCNVRRMDDKVSRWLLTNWYEPYRDHPNMLAAVALARFVNLPESLQDVTRWVVVSAGSCPWSMVKMKLRDRKAAGMPVWNNAYMVSPGKWSDKIDAVVDGYCRPLSEDPPPVSPRSMRGTWEAIHDRNGFGSFMAGQVVADLRWAVTGTWDDRTTWAPRGPGSMRGLNRFAGRPPGDRAADRNWDTEFAAVIEVCSRELPTSITGRLEAHDYQNCLCEYDKYERVLGGEGKPKQLYRSGQ